MYLRSSMHTGRELSGRGVKTEEKDDTRILCQLS